jgi:hypothetical protein
MVRMSRSMSGAGGVEVVEEDVGVWEWEVDGGNEAVPGVMRMRWRCVHGEERNVVVWSMWGVWMAVLRLRFLEDGEVVGCALEVVVVGAGSGASVDE